MVSHQLSAAPGGDKSQDFLDSLSTRWAALKVLKEATGRQRHTGSCLREELSAGARQSSPVTTDDPEMGQDAGKESFGVCQVG